MSKTCSNFSAYNAYPSRVHSGLIKEVTLWFQLLNYIQLAQIYTLDSQSTYVESDVML
jgi:hypothetical protein